jgi:hypothetical protein
MRQNRRDILAWLGPVEALARRAVAAESADHAEAQ